MSGSVVIAAGGTGGHLVPGFAIASALRAREPSLRISFIGTSRGMEGTLVPEAGYEIFTTRVRPFSRTVRGMTSAASLAPAITQAVRILARVGASIVIGMGGYASVPAVIAARVRRLPSLIHEANAIPGMANQIAMRFTRNIAVTYPQTAQSFGPRAVVTGMPLREEIATLDRTAMREEALAFFGLDASRLTVLVIGGSLGAVRIDRAVASLVQAWHERADVQFLVATGRGNEHELEEVGPPLCHARGFIDRMDLAYAAADVVIARAGSSSVAEIAAAGLPSILVPWPHARRREQHANATLLTEPGAGILLEDRELDRLGSVLTTVLDDAHRRADMGRAARAQARTDAADRLAAWTLRLMGRPA